MWNKLKFSQYRGKTLPQIVFTDPDYFFWAYEKGVYEIDEALNDQAETVYRRARSIHIPQVEGEVPLVAECTIDPDRYRFGELKLIPVTEAFQGSDDRVLTRSIDMSVPRSLKEFDKPGNKRFVQKMKALLFGTPHILMDRAQCEDFFDEECNFDDA